MKIADIKNLLQQNPTPEQLADLATDARIGVQKLLTAYHKKLQQQQKEQTRFCRLLSYERRYWQAEATYVAGMDEAGRGPLAGPLVIAAVIFPPSVFIEGLDDSKKLSSTKRAALYQEILAQALAISVNVVCIANIDRLNIYQATKKGMEENLRHLEIQPQVALVDAMQPEVPGMTIVPIIHGDALSASIAAASIIAKVTRDKLMLKLDKQYPQYGFAQNKGYGSQQHMEALAQYGASPVHRRSYEPVRSMQLEPILEGTNCVFSLQVKK